MNRPAFIATPAFVARMYVGNNTGRNSGSQPKNSVATSPGEYDGEERRLQRRRQPKHCPSKRGGAETDERIREPPAQERCYRGVQEASQRGAQRSTSNPKRARLTLSARYLTLLPVSSTLIRRLEESLAASDILRHHIVNKVTVLFERMSSATFKQDLIDNVRITTRNSNGKTWIAMTKFRRSMAIAEVSKRCCGVITQRSSMA